MLKEFFMTTYTITLPIILTSVLSYVVYLLKQQGKERNANSEGTKCLLRVRLIEYHDKYVTLGYIPSYALSNWDEMHKAYNNLKGNGMIEGMDKEIRELPIR